MKIQSSIIVFSLLGCCAFSECLADEVSYTAGQACDSKRFDPQCEQNHTVVCRNNKIHKLDCKDSMCAKVVQETSVDCNHDAGEMCNFTSSKKNKSVVLCVDVKEPCKQSGDTIQTCVKKQKGFTWIHKYQCIKNKGTDFYLNQIQSTKCHDGFGVCGENGECLQPKACEKPETYCEDDNLHTCIKNKLLIEECAEKKSPEICAVIDEKARCIQERDACTTEGETMVSSCNKRNMTEHLKICKRANNGKLYYVQNGERRCIDKCNEKNKACAEERCTQVGETKQVCQKRGYEHGIDIYTCVQNNYSKIYQFTKSYACGMNEVCDDIKGCVPSETCSPKTFVSHCDGDVLITCHNARVTRTSCFSLTESGECAVINNTANCYNMDDMCLIEGETITKACNRKKNELIQKKCMRAENGKLYYAPQPPKPCKNGCNAEGTDCFP